MRIENPTLAHFRHFSSLLTNLPSTTVESALQIDLFMQNKPNFRKAQMNVSSLITKDYRKNDAFAVRKNKPNTNPIRTQSKPIKPNSPSAIRNTRYEIRNTNPIQTQFQKGCGDGKKK